MDNEIVDPKQPLQLESATSEGLEFEKDYEETRSEGKIYRKRAEATPDKSKDVGDKIDDSLSAFNVESEEEISDIGRRRVLFMLFWAGTLFLNLDTGVIPTA